MNGAALVISPQTVPVAALDARLRFVDGEALVYRDGALHVLSTTAALILECCDGQSTAAQIVGEIAAAFTVDRASVERDVLEALGTLVDLGVVTEAGHVSIDPQADGLQLIADPPGSCATCESSDVWAARSVFAVGRRAVAVGTEEARIDAGVRAVVEAHALPAGVELPEDVPPFYGLSFAAPVADTGTQPLHRLQRGATVAVASRNPERVIRALLAHLASHGDLEALGLVALPARAVVGAAGACVLPRPRNRVHFERRARALSLTPVDGPVAFVDVATSELVVGAPGVAIDESALSRLAHDLPALGSTDEAALWGRYPLVAIGSAAGASRPGALLTYAPRSDEESDPERVVAALLQLTEVVPVLDAVTPPDLAGALAACG
jgi:Coenzyme PQQ synthesis protein D (PqqD)